jgi:hypothetical protein
MSKNALPSLDYKAPLIFQTINLERTKWTFTSILQSLGSCDFLKKNQNA